MATSTAKTDEGGVLSSVAEINVTPLVDIMLVLLIIFMLATPAIQQRVDLPQANAGTVDIGGEISLTITQNKEILVDSRPVELGGIGRTLRALVKENPSLVIHVRGDRNVPYGFVAKVITEAKRAHVRSIGLVTQPEASRTPL